MGYCGYCGQLSFDSPDQFLVLGDICLDGWDIVDNVDQVDNLLLMHQIIM